MIPRAYTLGFIFKGDSLCIILKRYLCDLCAHIDSSMVKLCNEKFDYDDRPFPETVLVKIIMQLAWGLKGMHECGIYHRDLKSTKILVTRYCKPNGERSPHIDIHITDFSVD